jgi:hypothetical protein
MPAFEHHKDESAAAWDSKKKQAAAYSSWRRTWKPRLPSRLGGKETPMFRMHGRRMRLGQIAALLTFVVVAHSATPSWAQEPGKETAVSKPSKSPARSHPVPDSGKLDLGYVSGDAAGTIIVRPAAILRAPGVGPIRAKLDNYLQKEGVILKESGFSIAGVEQITHEVMPAGDGIGMSPRMLRTVKPLDWIRSPGLGWALFEPKTIGVRWSMVRQVSRRIRGRLDSD